MRRLGKRFYSAVNSAAESTKKQPKNQLQVDDFKNITTQQYVGSRPFPMNPFFQPKPPIANSTKKEIYSLYLEDPSKWTPRALAEKYGISIVRTEAILRLKSLENSFIEKVRCMINKEYSCANGTCKRHGKTVKTYHN